jgi:hypothetical protein
MPTPEQPHPDRARHNPRTVLLLVIPALVLAVSAAEAWCIGAHWIAVYYDPDYHYLLNALSVAEGHAPHHIDHPGTTVQELGAAVLRMRHALTGSGHLRDAVLKHPEPALAAIGVCMRLAHALALFLFGLRMRQLTGSTACAVAAQAASMASMISLLSLWRVSPEPLVMTFSLLLACATLRSLNAGPAGRTRHSVSSGLILGLGIATKFTFLPLAILPLWGIATGRRLAFYASVAAGAFLLAISPILSQYRVLLDWVRRLVVADGVYGKPAGHFVINPANYLADFGRMVAQEPVGLLAAVASAGLLVYLCRSRKWAALGPGERAVARALAFVSAAEFLQYLLVAKHPGDRYLIPALSLVGLNVALGCSLLRAAYAAALPRRLACAGVIVLTVWGCWLGVRLERRLATARVDSRARIALHEAALQKVKEGGTLACSYAASSPVFAMVFADWWTGGRFGVSLREMYPGQWNYNVWGKTYSVGARQIPKTRAAQEAAAGRLWIQGPKDLLPEEFDYEQIGSAGDEGLWLAKPRAPFKDPGG